MNLGTIPPNDLAKLCLSANTTEAWEEFVRRFQPIIRTAIHRTAARRGAATPQFVEDMVQEVFLDLCDSRRKALEEFVPREPDSIFGFLRRISENRTRDQLRSESRIKRWGGLRREEEERISLDSVVASYSSLNETNREVLHDEIDREIQRLIPNVLLERDRIIFWLYFRQGFSARDIADVPGFGLSVKGVESLLHRVAAYVRQNLRLVPLPVKRRAGGKLSGSDRVSGESTS